MVLSEHIPDNATDRAAEALERLPNYCVDCGEPLVVAGGYDERTTGVYDHIDPVLMCPQCATQHRHGMAFDPEEGLDHYELGLDEEIAVQLFGEYVPWCNLHTCRMEATKDYHVDNCPARQYKCPECSQLATVLYTGGRL